MATNDSGSGGYLEHLSGRDLELLAQASGIEGGSARLRADPRVIGSLLGDDAVFASVFGDHADDPLLHASPFLVFAVAVGRAAQELDRLPYLHEWAGPHQRIPVFVADELRDFAGDPARRLFLAQLLTSYTHVASGSIWVRTSRGPRRRRFSELDLLRLVALLDELPEGMHPGLFRRLGDLALFLTGVFPDHTAGRMFRPVDLQRLGRALRPRGGAGPAADRLQEALEVRGAVGLLELLGERWYRLAAASGPPAGASGVTEAVAERFGQARRVLNHVTDRYLFPSREQWFPTAPA